MPVATKSLDLRSISESLTPAIEAVIKSGLLQADPQFWAPYFARHLTSEARTSLVEGPAEPFLQLGERPIERFFKANPDQMSALTVADLTGLGGDFMRIALNKIEEMISSRRHSGI